MGWQPCVKPYIFASKEGSVWITQVLGKRPVWTDMGGKTWGAHRTTHSVARGTDMCPVGPLRSHWMPQVFHSANHTSKIGGLKLLWMEDSSQCQLWRIAVLAKPDVFAVARTHPFQPLGLSSWITCQALSSFQAFSLPCLFAEVSLDTRAWQRYSIWKHGMSPRDCRAPLSRGCVAAAVGQQGGRCPKVASAERPWPFSFVFCPTWSVCIRRAAQPQRRYWLDHVGRETYLVVRVSRNRTSILRILNFRFSLFIPSLLLISQYLLCLTKNLCNIVEYVGNICCITLSLHVRPLTCWNLIWNLWNQSRFKNQILKIYTFNCCVFLCRNLFVCSKLANFSLFLTSLELLNFSFSLIPSCHVNSTIQKRNKA